MAEFLNSNDGTTYSILIDDEQRIELIDALRELLTDINGELTVDEGVLYEIHEGLR